MQSFKLLAFGAASALALALASCAQPEPEPIGVEPIYNKLGAATCSSEYPVMSTNAQGVQTCVASCRSGYTTGRDNYGRLACMPPGGCPPGTGHVTGAPQDECIPIRDGGGDQPNNPNGRPTGGATTGN